MVSEDKEANLLQCHRTLSPPCWAMSEEARQNKNFQQWPAILRLPFHSVSGGNL